MLRVFENHITYDCVHDNEDKCVACTSKRQHFGIAGAYLCYGECQQKQIQSITYSVMVKSS